MQENKAFVFSTLPPCNKKRPTHNLHNICYHLYTGETLTLCPPDLVSAVGTCVKPHIPYFYY